MIIPHKHGTCLKDNLSHMKGHFHNWSRNVFGSVRKKKAHLLARLEGIQRRQANGTMHSSLYELETNLQAELQDILYQEEIIWYQRSRTKWMQDGDHNTKYYHLKATSRKKNNCILMLRDASAVWMEDALQIKTHASQFFLDLFTETVTHEVHLNTRYHFTSLDDATTTALGGDVRDSEIDDSVHIMQPWKAPRPDGLQAGFYHHNWEKVRQDCYGFVKHIWANPELVANVNDTDIFLIPKVPKPEFITQFRPISLCNVNYKIITKIIVIRLKPLMPQIISPYQTGFIPTRSIHENIVVAQEMLHSMRRMRGRTSFFAIKVDLAKAYDRIRWSFINKVLTEVGVPTNIQALIMQCITKVTTNVLWDGSRFESFHQQHGICQGDH